jgi:Ca2+-binding EF-hand superfamily protein
MLENLLNEHSAEITSLLSKYGLSGAQGSLASNTIVQAISGFFATQASTGNLDLNHVMDLFNKNTPNQSNPIFNQISQSVSGSLLKNGIGQDTVSKISSGGLDEIFKIFQSGKLGNIDMNMVTNLVSSLSGKGGDLGGLLGNLGGLLGNK